MTHSFLPVVVFLIENFNIGYIVLYCAIVLAHIFRQSWRTLLGFNSLLHIFYIHLLVVFLIKLLKFQLSNACEKRANNCEWLSASRHVHDFVSMHSKIFRWTELEYRHLTMEFDSRASVMRIYLNSCFWANENMEFMTLLKGQRYQFGCCLSVRTHITSVHSIWLAGEMMAWRRWAQK